MRAASGIALAALLLVSPTSAHDAHQSRKLQSSTAGTGGRQTACHLSLQQGEQRQAGCEALAAPNVTLATDLITKFLVVGDWGRDGDMNQSEVADLMTKVASGFQPNFIISSGDNFYESGLSSTSDKMFQTSFTDIYTDNTLQVPWYLVLGNHDYGEVKDGYDDHCAVTDRQNCGNHCCWSPLHQLSVELTERDWRWNLQRQFSMTLGTKDAEIFFVDTSPFIERYRDKPWADAPGGLLSQSWAAQLAELETSLAKSDADWKIVVGHHPVISNGKHGGTEELQQHLQPLLEEYGVQAYFCGHDHNLQHLDSRKVAYIVSGAGSKIRAGWAGDQQPAKFLHDGSGFVAVTLSRGKMGLEFYGIPSEKPLYSVNIPRSSRHDSMVGLHPAR